MAKGGGGSWKVAYADFVTAMMAFFLVMWIGSQDQKIKSSVANYFIDPMGHSKTPVKSGSMSDHSSNGSVPESDTALMGRGRASHSPPNGANSPPTKVLNDWLVRDEKSHLHWKNQSKKIQDSAAGAKDVREKLTTVQEYTVKELSKQLKDHFTEAAANQTKGVYQDLTFTSLKDVNWTELAEDLLAR